MLEQGEENVENYAELLDRWYDKGRTRTIHSQYEATLQLVSGFRTEAEKKVVTLKSKNATILRGQREQLWRKKIESIKGQITNPSNKLDKIGVVTKVADHSTLDLSMDKNAKDFQQSLDEKATWDLLQIIIELHHPSPETQLNKDGPQRQTDLEQLHRYASEDLIWEKFIQEDNSAKEKHLVLRWLERCADSDDQNLSLVAEQLAAEFGRGGGTWSHGWLDSREKVKAEKRMQPWDVETDPPHIPLSTKPRGLVSQLDPDAPTRQRKSLDAPDEHYDQLTWMACYDMLRRGKPWKSIREWCQDRNEHWRGASLGMASSTSKESHNSPNSTISSPLWRRTCQLACKGSLHPFERACYGLLSGDLDEVESICETWDDYLYARYNSLLLSGFDQFLEKNYPERIPRTIFKKLGLFDAITYFGGWEISNIRVMETLREDKRTYKQARYPLKMVQSSLISRTFDDLVYKVGIAISKTASTKESRSKLIAGTNQDLEDCYMGIAEDHEAMRMIVHISLVFRALGIGAPSMIHDSMYENVLVAYIETLRMVGKIDLLPLYAAQLSMERAEQTLGRILPDIRNQDEQQLIVNLCLTCGLNVASILAEHYDYCMSTSELEHGNLPLIQKFEILEATSDPLWPGQRIRTGFLLQDVSEDEEMIIQSLHWYLYLDGGWNTTFTALTDAMKAFLLRGRTAAARKLARELSVQRVSTALTPGYFGGRSFDIMEQESIRGDSTANDVRRSTRSGAKTGLLSKSQPNSEEENSNIRRLKKQCRTYYELQQLVFALEILAEWNDVEMQLVEYMKPTKVDRAQQGQKQLNDELRVRELFDQIRENLEPLFIDFLAHPADDTELTQLMSLYRAYIPEILLAYNSVIQAMAHFTTRETLLLSFGLATEIAQENRPQLTDAFKATGRMTELITAFAQTSRDLLRISDKEKEQRRGKEHEQRTRRRGRGTATVKRSRDWKGETMEIWNVNASN